VGQCICCCAVLPNRDRLSKSLSQFSRTELQTASGSRSLFCVGLAFGTAVSILQLYNAAVLNAFWPFFLGIISLLLAGVFEFVRLVVI